MRDPNPTVILIPGLGMIAWGKDKSESRVTAEFYNCAVEVMRGAEAIDEYTALPAQEAFDIEYWLLEEAKLKRMPPEKELARKVVAVVGAGSGIGREVALRLALEGAHIVCVDRDAEGANDAAKAITDKYGLGIGVATVVKASGGRGEMKTSHARISVEPTGQVKVYTEVSPHGHGTETTFAQIAAELRTQYMLGYYPINKERDERYRHIKVTSSRKNVVIRARPGYLATNAK